MKIQSVIWGACMLALLSCSDDETGNNFRDDLSIKSLNGTWKVISFEDYRDQTVEFKTEENSRGLDIVVKFDDTENPNKFSGQNTTNELFGKFDYVGTRHVELSYGSTYVSQPKWGYDFNEILNRGEVTFEINILQLRIYNATKTKSVTLQRQ